MSFAPQLALGLRRIPMARAYRARRCDRRSAMLRARSDAAAPTWCTATAPRARPMPGLPSPASADPGLHAAWRQPALPAGHCRRPLLLHAREAAEPPHRSVPVRERLIARLYRAKVGEPRPWSAVVPQRRRRRSEFATVAPAPTQPTSLHRRTARRSKASTCCSTRWHDCARTGRTLTATIVGDGADRADLQARRSVSALPTPCASAADAGARGLRARPCHGRALARGIPALYRAGGRRGRQAADRHQCRRHSRKFSARRRTASSRRTTATASQRALADAVNDPETHARRRRALRERVRTTFSLDDMVDGGLDAYREALGRPQKLKCAISFC